MGRRLSLIYAEDSIGGIGLDNDLPWARSAPDMSQFRTYTMGKPIIMGRRTAESLGKPLDGRTNVVITRRGIKGVGWVVAKTPYEVMDNHVEGEVFVIGGASIFEIFEPFCDRIYRTVLPSIYKCDTYMPDINYYSDYDIVGVTKWDDGVRHAVYNRKGTV